MNLDQIMDSWLRPMSLVSWFAYALGLMASWSQEQAASMGLAMAGFIGVLVTALVKGYELWSNSRRKQRELDLEQALAYDKRARDAGTTLDRLEGHVEQASTERAELAIQLRDLRDTVKQLVATCQGERCKAIVECLAPNSDGTPGCGGQGPDAAKTR